MPKTYRGYTAKEVEALRKFNAADLEVAQNLYEFDAEARGWKGAHEKECRAAFNAGFNTGVDVGIDKALELSDRDRDEIVQSGLGLPHV